MDLGDIDFDHATALVHGQGVVKTELFQSERTALKFLQSYVVGIRPYLIKDPKEQALFVTGRGNRCAYHIIKNWLKKYVGPN